LVEKIQETTTLGTTKFRGIQAIKARRMATLTFELGKVWIIILGTYLVTNRI
jgi:hypothetical protein